jgi:hypothetical protein
MALDEITAEHIIALVARMRADGYAVGMTWMRKHCLVGAPDEFCFFLPPKF